MLIAVVMSLWAVRRCDGEVLKRGVLSSGGRGFYLLNLTGNWRGGGEASGEQQVALSGLEGSSRGRVVESWKNHCGVQLC